MPLINFGSIMSFAEELEKQDEAFYTAAAANPAFAEHKDLFEQFLKDARKNIKNVQRVRRENVTEMILEKINDFTLRRLAYESLRPVQDTKNVDRTGGSYAFDQLWKYHGLCRGVGKAG